MSTTTGKFLIGIAILCLVVLSIATAQLYTISASLAEQNTLLKAQATAVANAQTDQNAANQKTVDDAQDAKAKTQNDAIAALTSRVDSLEASQTSSVPSVTSQAQPALQVPEVTAKVEQQPAQTPLTDTSGATAAAPTFSNIGPCQNGSKGSIKLLSFTDTAGTLGLNAPKCFEAANSKGISVSGPGFDLFTAFARKGDGDSSRLLVYVSGLNTSVPSSCIAYAADANGAKNADATDTNVVLKEGMDADFTISNPAQYVRMDCAGNGYTMSFLTFR